MMDKDEATSTPTPTTSEATTTATPPSSDTTQQQEFVRAKKGLDVLNIEEELHCSLDGAVTTFRGREKNSLLYVQVKRVNKAVGRVEDVVHAEKVLSKLSHDRVLRHIAWYQTPRHLWVVSELCAGGTLRDVLIHHSLEFDSVRFMALDLISALQYVHGEKQLAHGDIRPENVCLTENGVAKLAGFSLAQSTAPESAIAPDHGASIRLREHIRQHAEYMAPELLRALCTSAETIRITPQSDVWSLGVLLYECTTGSTPFAGTSFAHLMERICEDDPNYFREGQSRPFTISGFLKQLLDKKPENRVWGSELKSLAEALPH